MRKQLLILSILFYGIVGYGQPLIIPGVVESGDISVVNMISNGTFDNDTDWTEGADWNISGGTANFDNGGTSDLVQDGLDMITAVQPFSDYTVEFDISNLTGSNGYFQIKSDDGSVTYVAQMSISNGSYSEDFSTGDVGSDLGILIRVADDGAFSIDNVILYER